MSNNIISLLLVSIFKNIVKDNVITSYIDFIKSLEAEESLVNTLKLYSEFITSLYDSQENQNIYEYLKKLIYQDENILSKGCSKCLKENQDILNTAEYELDLFHKLLKYDYKNIKSILEGRFPQSAEIIKHLPIFYSNPYLNFDLEDIINSYSKNGWGIFSCYTAFKFNENKEVIPIQYLDTITFNDLKNYKYQQEVLKNNTLAFIKGKDANNILLYGDRGCGKSSSVKALINEYKEHNLKIIQITKESFIYLPELYEKIRLLPSKFIIFADDISFEEDDRSFSSVKAVLEGSLSNKPKNVIIYATTNRMHLVKESFTAREGNEIHYNDTIDEMVSLSDRFGIVLTFSLLTKNEYLDIVEKIASDCCIEINDNLRKDAEKFAALKAIRTPRVARQFIIDYLASN